MVYRYPKVPINSKCVVAPKGMHKWITHPDENGNPVTWCEHCKAMPK